ncbi:adenylate/guanylate cyclase domain-containing protein [Aquihabitans daechungensis]|uniref:adenylate/guanylate cyclase domain-containing protein n=1 Tax=Aquihabitans daechungensis TaxID=1052257 RepID=UPI003BA0E303
MTETIAVVFTDLVDSTRLLSSVGDDAFDAVRREHFEVLRTAAAEHRGEEVKNLGDGRMVVFRSASDAISAAVAMQAGCDRNGRRAGQTAVGSRSGRRSAMPRPRTATGSERPWWRQPDCVRWPPRASSWSPR